MATVSAEAKILAVKQYYSGEGSLNQIAAKFGVRRSTLQKWQLNYDLFGEDGLRHRAGNHHYPAIMKQQTVELYFAQSDEYRGGLQKISATVKITAGAVDHGV